jgi:glycosyltransferase involved in cell wall biosynthesis
MNQATAPAKVVAISCVGEKGGAEVYLLNFLRNLNPDRFRPSVVLLRPGPFETDLRDAGIETFTFRRHRMRNCVAVAQSILQLRRLIRRDRFQLVHSNAFRAHVYGGIAARLAGVPSVWSVHTAEKNVLSTRGILSIPVTSVTANCPRTADWFAARNLPVNMIWPPVDLVALASRTPRRNLAAKYGISERAPWIGMASRLQRYKGQERLLRAVAALPAEFANAQVLIMGGALFGMEETYADELRRLATTLGIASRTHLTGFVPDEDLRGLIAGCEVVVHPALDEDFGLIVAEAQAMERPVVAFATVGPSAIIEHDVTGALVPVGDDEQLCQALTRVLRMPAEARAAMGAAGRRRVESLFAAPMAARRLEAVYASALGGPPLRLDGSRQPIVAMA